MIDSEVTFREKGYLPEDLKSGSHKCVWRVCDECKQGRWVQMRFVRDRCTFCVGRQKVVSLSAANKGSLRPKSIGTRRKMSAARIGKSRSMLVRKRISAAKQGIPYDEWEKFAKGQPYCPRFNEVCRESNREKYGRKCFLCGVAEENNRDKTGKSKKLSVHHIDLNKMQGCDRHDWKLIPVCTHCHGQLHKEPWISRIQYLLT